ncbi:MFS transporter [Glycocaulis profundi]|nr:MFS transporter [Glycocaulis profundi]
MRPRTLRALRWWIIGLVMMGAMVNYLTRSTLGVAAPTLMEDLGITTQQYSWITGAFQAGIMMQPLAGYVLDVIGLKKGLAIFVLAWSAITMLHGFATNWVAFAWLRGALGLAEGSANPAGMKTVSEWFPAKERGLASGVYNIGASVGSMLAPPLVAWAIIVHSWQSAFFITGALGFIWAAAWMLLYQSPSRHKAMSDRERAYIAEGQEDHLQSDGARPSIPSILKQRNFWGIALPRFLADPTWGTLAFWVPLYLMSVRGFDLTQIAMTAWLPFVAADLGCMFGPAVVLFLQKRGISLINARRCAFTLGAVMMIGVAFVGFVDNPYLAVALLCLGGFAHQTLSVTVITMSSDLFKRNEVATVTGMAGTFGNAGVLVFSLMIGGLVTVVGYNPFFIALAALDILGAIILWTFVRERDARARGGDPADAPEITQASP